MLALEVQRFGDPVAALDLAHRPVPTPGAGEVLVRVAASVLNFPDVLLCRGSYQVRPPLPFVPGIEASGRIEDAGPGVDPDRIGERVLGPTMLPHGGFAPWTLMRASEAFPVPSDLPDPEAASLFIAYQTAWLGLHRRAGLALGETVVVHGAAGAVGTAAIQLARAAGARVVAVVRGEAKKAVVGFSGAPFVIDRLTENWVDRVLEITSGRGADVVVDTVGGEAFDDSTKCVASEGRILIVGFASGRIPVAAVNHTLLKNYAMVGMHLAAYRSGARGELTTCHAALTDLLANGNIRPVIGARINLSEVPHYLQELGEGTPSGRIVVNTFL